jgi:hypothetical protein
MKRKYVKKNKKVLKINLKNRSSATRLKKHLATEHPSTKGRMKVV